MSIVSSRTRCRVAALAFAFLASAAGAQVVAPPSEDPAVRLAANMRELGRNPNSIPALTGAGESALAVGDAEAAFNFLSRAQELSPIDGRVKFLLGSVLLQMDRPADALRLFGEAQTLGISTSQLQKERGLAYDLQGDQKRAQAEYRAFLKSADDDEVTRRLALSMGIAGERDKALELLNPLLRRRDQSAWRARTFILAINGNLKEADQIAAQVMPSDNGESLKPFLRRLAVLSPGQQALATNFGIMPAGGVPSGAPVRMAQADPSQALVPSSTPLAEKPAEPAPSPSPSWARESSKDRRSKKDKKGQPDLAAVVPAAPAGPTPPPIDAPRPNFAIDALPPSQMTRPAAPAIVRPPVLAPVVRPVMPSDVAVRLPGLSGGDELAHAASEGTAKAAPLPVLVASVSPPPAPEVPVAQTPQPAPAPAAPTIVAAASPPTPVDVTQAPAVPPSIASFDLASTKPPVAAAEPVVAVAAPAPVPAAAPAVVTTATPRAAQPATPGFGEPTPPVPTQVAMTETAVPPSVAAPQPPTEVPVVPPAVDAGATQAAPATPVPAPVPAQVDAPAAPVQPVAEASPVPEPAPASAPAPETAPAGLASIIATLTPEQESAAGPLPGEREIRAARLAARKKAEAEAAAKSAADTKKAEEEKKKSEEAAKAKANPARTWVQIATGSNKAGLAGTVRSIRAKAPKAMGSLAGWYAPVRASNRVLVGPMKGATEARSLVASLAREGVIASYWTSAAGEEVFRIGK